MTYLNFIFKEKEYRIENWLASWLNSLVFNIEKDWDFVVIITGDRQVRTGKSVLGMCICAYLAYLLKLKKLNEDAYDEDDIYFDNKVMMTDAQKKPKYSINHYDEGREGLAASKSMQEVQRDLLDFFAECGQMNHIFVIVCPDFFELKEEIAVARSEYLFNVYRREEQLMTDFMGNGEKMPITSFIRGNFEAFSRDKKAALYDIAKTTRRKKYNHVKCNFVGHFTNQYTIDEEVYRKKKAEALSRFKERHNEAATRNANKANELRDRMILSFCNRFGLDTKEVKDIVEETTGKSIGLRRIQEIIHDKRLQVGKTAAGERNIDKETPIGEVL